MSFYRIALMLQVFALSSCATPKDAAVSIDADSNFDLTDYIFHKNVHTNGGSVSVVEKFYRKSNTNEIAMQPSFRFTRSDNKIDVTTEGINGPLIRYIINDNEVEEQRPSLDDTRTFNRFARLGDIYLDADYTSVSMRETCVVTEFFDTYYLSSATGSISLSHDVYDNVLKVHCLCEFYEEGNRRTNFRWNLYYAKDVGMIFKDGDWISYLGPVYALYDY